MENIICGHKISQLLTVDSIQDDDLLLISDQENSVTIKYKDLTKKIIQNILLYHIKVGSMAYEQSALYSKIDHNHVLKYTDVKFHSLNQSGQFIMDVTEIKDIDEYVFDKRQLSVYAQPREKVKPQKPKIGTLRFSYGTDPVEITSPTFDGWVYADGKTYQINDFNGEVTNQFEIIDNKYFRVPNLSSFIQISNKPVDNITEQQETIGLKQHTHTLEPIGLRELKATVDCEVETYATVGSNKPHFGRTPGNTPNNTQWKEAELSAKLKLNSITIPNSYVGDSPVPTTTPKPRHTKVGIMVYIGGRKKPYTNY